MSKANRKAIEAGNFWDINWVHGAYAGTPAVDADETKARHKKKKDRLRTERHDINIMRKGVWTRIHLRTHKTKRQKIHEQIQYGFDLAKWWGEQHE